MNRIYPVVVARVVDGDTVILDVDLGFHLWLRGQSFRLLGVNAREHTQPGGREAAANLAGLLPVGTQLVITSVKNDKFGGRFDAMLTLADDTDLALQLIRTEWAAAWNGTGTKPLPPWPRTRE